MEEVTTKSGMSVGVVVGIAVLVAVVSGGGTYAYMNNKATKEKSDLNAQITDLQKQVATSGTTATTTAPSSSTSTAAPSSTATISEWKTYTDSDWSFSVKYPKDARVLTKANGGLASDATEIVVAFEWVNNQDTEADVTLVDSPHTTNSTNAYKTIPWSGYGGRYLELRVSKEATSKYQEVVDSFQSTK